MFLHELYGTVASETTLKRALKSLLDKRLIFRRYQPHARYDAPEYQLHVSALQLLLDVLGTAGGQAVIPSILEGLQALPAQELTPSDCQQLLPSQACRGAETDPNYKKNKKKGDLPANTLSSTSDVVDADSAAPPLDFSSLLTSVATLSQEQKQQLRAALYERPSVPPAQALPPPTALKY